MRPRKNVKPPVIVAHWLLAVNQMVDYYGNTRAKEEACSSSKTN